MHKEIILANIGNRNIKYHNQGYPNNEIPKQVFFEKTKFILEHEEEFENITLNILPSILEKFPQAFLYLFTTLQNPVNFQDTYYEGLILEKILQQQYPLIKVKTITIEGVRANDEEVLIPWYREQLDLIRKSHDEATYIMYDTGGTPQQKNSLKSVVEFYFKKNVDEINPAQAAYMLYQGNDNQQGGTIIEEIKGTASEKLSQLTNIKLLTQHNNYAAAKEISNGYGHKRLTQVLQYASLRWENMWHEIKRLNDFDKVVKAIPEFDYIKKFTNPAIHQLDQIEGISQVACRVCINLLSKTYNQQLSGNFSGAILTFHQFIETFIAAYIEANTDYPFYTNYWSAGTKWLKEIEENEADQYIKIFGRIPTGTSFPLLVYYAISITDTKDHLYSFLNNIKSTLSYFKDPSYPQNKKIDSLRNAIAHDGKGCTIEDFELYKPLIMQAYKKFITGPDPFKQINLLIEKLM